jgi:hypothetical protein
MRIRDDSRARIPGPLGTSPGGAAGRIPGPLGFASIVVMAPGAVATAVKTTTMPPPTNDQDNKDGDLASIQPVQENSSTHRGQAGAKPRQLPHRRHPRSAGLYVGRPHPYPGYAI